MMISFKPFPQLSLIEIIQIQLDLTVSLTYGLFLVPSVDAEAPGGGNAGVWKPNPGHE